MKLISGVVRPDKMEEVRQALSHANVYNLKVAEVHDLTPQPRETLAWMGHVVSPAFSIKMEIEVVVHDDDVDEVVGVILKTARTGAVGDGHVLVLPVEHRYSIRNGDRDVEDG